MISLTLDKKKVKAPTSWHEVTVAMAQKICNEWDASDKIALFNILTATNYAKVKASTDIGSKFFDVIDFVYFRSTVAMAPVPKALKIGCKIILIPNKVGKLSTGQLIYLRQKMEAVQVKLEADVKANPDLTKFAFKNGFIFDSLISTAVATYLQPLYDKADFDEERAQTIEAMILDMNIVDVYPIGFFFLKQQLNGGRTLMDCLLLKIQTRIASALNSLRWRRSDYSVR